MPANRRIGQEGNLHSMARPCLIVAMNREEWLEKLNDFRRSQGWGLAELGAKAAAEIGRDHPYAQSVISRFLRGQNTSDDLTRACARLMGIAPPAPGVADPQLRRWLDAGVALRQIAPVLFGGLLERVELLADLADPKKFGNDENLP